MNHDGERSDVVASTGLEEASQRSDNQAGASIQLWRAPNRIWPVFPTLVIARAASRLGRGQRRSPAVGEGGVVSVILDGLKVGAISPTETKVFPVSPGEHSLSLHFLGGLRRSRKQSFRLAQGEVKQFVCSLNAFAWPSVRPAGPHDLEAIERDGLRL